MRSADLLHLERRPTFITPELEPASRAQRSPGEGRMTPFEILYVCLEPFLPPLYRTVRRRLHHMTRANYGPALSILDVGGRKSPYTLGLPARVIITDLPRKSALQQKL